MSDFRARLMSEYSELQIRLEKLKEYILTPAYDSLPEIDRKDLKAQLGHMQRYHDVLSRRCSRLCN